MAVDAGGEVEGRAGPHWFWLGQHQPSGITGGSLAACVVGGFVLGVSRKGGIKILL